MLRQLVQPVRRKLKLVRKGDRAQWKLKNEDSTAEHSEDSPRVESLVAPQPSSSSEGSSHPQGQPAKSVRMESSVTVETRVCVRGKCEIVTKNK